MALAKVKTEMKGDTSRWGKREPIKKASRKRRRRADVKEAYEFALKHWRLTLGILAE
jgi:hypothetical protein